MYQLCLNKDPFTGIISEPRMVVKDNYLWIPFDPANTDYQAYLKWLDAGNTPLLAEGNAPIGADTPLPADEMGQDTPTTVTTE